MQGTDNTPAPIEHAGPLLTEREVAAILSVSPFTVARFRKSGHLAFLRVGGQIRYEFAAVRSFCDRARRAMRDDSGRALTSDSIREVLKRRARGRRGPA